MLKLRLDDEGFETMEGIGVSSSFSDYRLAWTLNHAFQWRFEYQENPLVIPSKKTTEPLVYHYHHFTDEIEKMQLFLIKNKQGGKALFEDYPQFDFVLFFKNNLTFDLDQLLPLLRNLDPIFAAYRCKSADFAIAPFLQFEGIYE
jgi:hypothetical protein